MIKRIINIVFTKGFIFTLVLSLFVLWYFYGELLRYPHHKYFGASGDGLQSYYAALYHVKFDHSYWHTDGMNYPYGEQVFYSGCQPFVTNIIKLVCHFVDISKYTLGILNLIMLFSIVFSALCLYLIFKHLKLPDFYSGVAATAIAFLSPQISRLAGHYSLTYQFAIPLFILLLFKFYQSPSIRKSLLIGFLTFFMAGTHFYFFGLFAILSVFYWCALYFSDSPIFSKTKFALKHFCIQLVSPYVLLQAIMLMIDNVKDRTNFPWGYLTYTSNWTGVLYPEKRFYTEWFEWFYSPSMSSWEGKAFIGIIATLVFLGIAVFILYHFIRREFKEGVLVTNNRLLNTFFWGSLIALFLSFGCPFTVHGYDEWLSDSGPLKQLRGIGRFAWPFYYVINIIAIYKLYSWASLRSRIAKQFWLGVILFFVSYDAYMMSIDFQWKLNNGIAELEDTQNNLDQDKWINEINLNDYQGIISLPYFHIGSENVWLGSEAEIINDVFITSLKTGLPTTSMILSRVSLGQTYKNIQLVKGPYRPLEIVNDFKSDKPFLVLASESHLDDEENYLLSKCKKIKSSKRFNIYELKMETLKHISDNLYNETSKFLLNQKTYTIDEYQSTDSLKTFIFKNYDDLPNKNSYHGKSCLEAKMKNYCQLFKGSLPNAKDGEYELSFWMGDFRTDIYPRLTVELAFVDENGNAYDTKYFSPDKNFSILDGNWALVEQKFKLRNKNDQLIVTVWHAEIHDDIQLLHIDDLLIRPIGTNVFRKGSSKEIMLNNKTYISK